MCCIAGRRIGVAGCSGGGSASAPITPAVVQGPSFVVGTDAPMASVVSFSVQIESITATDQNNNTVQLISGTPTVDFARFNGLRTLLDMNDVNAAVITTFRLLWEARQLAIWQTNIGSAPTIATMTASYPQGQRLILTQRL